MKRQKKTKKTPRNQNIKDFYHHFWLWPYLKLEMTFKFTGFSDTM